MAKSSVAHIILSKFLVKIIIQIQSLKTDYIILITIGIKGFEKWEVIVDYHVRQNYCC